MTHSGWPGSGSGSPPAKRSTGCDWGSGPRTWGGSAAGKGALLCSAHFGSYDPAFSLLGASGFPVTTIGRWQHNYTVGMSSAERRVWDVVYARRMRRHRHRPNIEP